MYLVCNCRELWMRLFSLCFLFRALLLSLLETFLLGWSVSMIFTQKCFRILRLALGGLVTLIYAPAGAPGLDAWDLRSLYLQSKIPLCELLDRLGTHDFPKFLLQARVVGMPKNDGSPDRRPLTVMSCIWRMRSRRFARHTGIWMDRWMRRPFAGASDGAWELRMDIDETASMIKTSPF